MSDTAKMLFKLAAVFLLIMVLAAGCTAYLIKLKI